VVDPVQGRTINQDMTYKQELAEAVKNNVPAQLLQDMREESDAAKTHPDFAAIHDTMLPRYVAAGNTPQKAEDLATRDAAFYVTKAQGEGIKPSELFAQYNPKTTVGEAPADTDILHQQAIENIRSVVEAANQPGDQKKWTVYGPVSEWLRGAAKISWAGSGRFRPRHRRRCNPPHEK